MRLTQLTIIIIFLQIGQVYGQSEGFEKDLNVFSDPEANGSITGSEEFNNSIYSNFTVDCDLQVSACYSEFHKYNVGGELVWAYKLDSLFVPFQSFTVEDDKVYILGKRQIPTNDKFFKLVTIDTLGNFIEEQYLNLSTEYYQTQEATNIDLIQGLIYITGFGYDPNKTRFVGYVRVINLDGEEVFLRQWDQIELGYRRTVIWEVFEKEGVDSLVYFSVIEDVGEISDFLPTDRYCLYSLNIQDERIDTIFHTDNRNTKGLSPSLIGFNSIGNTIFADTDPETLIGNGIEAGEVENGHIDYEGALWISRIRDTDFEEEHNILAFRFNSLHLLVSNEDEIYISGVLDWSRFDEEIWWNSTCFIAKFSSAGEFLWQKIYVEIGEGINNKSQYIYSLDEMEDQSLIGLGASSETFSNSRITKGWMLKVNEHGCLDGTDDCPFINFLDSTTIVNNLELESFTLDVSPNPVANICEVNFGEPISGVLKLIELTTGVIVKDVELNNVSILEMDLSSFNTGAYSLIFFAANNKLNVMSKNIMVTH